MSYGELDAEREQFFDDLYKEFRASGLDDGELYDRIVDDFKASRLRAFYADNPLAAETADGPLAQRVDYLEELDVWDRSFSPRIQAAIKNNSQVEGAWGVPDRIRRLVTKWAEKGA